MKTELNKLDHLMIITRGVRPDPGDSGLPAASSAEAGVVVRAQIGSVGVAVAPDTPRG